MEYAIFAGVVIGTIVLVKILTAHNKMFFKHTTTLETHDKNIRVIIFTQDQQGDLIKVIQERLNVLENEKSRNGT